MRYLVVIEKGESSFGAYVPDLPGCIAAAKTEEEVRTLIREAIEFHIEGLKEDGEPKSLQRTRRWRPLDVEFIVGWFSQNEVLT